MKKLSILLLLFMALSPAEAADDGDRTSQRGTEASGSGEERRVEEIRMERAIRERMRALGRNQETVKESRVERKDEAPAATSGDVWRNLEKSVEESNEF